MAQIGIIINPYSRKIKRMKTDPVEYYKKIGGDSVDIRLTRSPEDIIKAARDFKKQGIEYLAISGGDGSIHLVISKFISVYRKYNLPYILILKDGSMNNIAKSYKLKGKGVELLKKLLKAIEKGEKVNIVYRNTIKVRDMLCFLFGLGLTTNFIYEFNKGGNKTPWKAIKVILMGVWAVLLNKKNEGLLKRTNLKILVDGRALWFNDIFAVYAATIVNLAMGFNLTPRAYEKENMFHILVTGMNPKEFLLNINKIRRGVTLKHPDHYDNIASKLQIISGKEFLYQMDGDIYKSDGKLTAEAGPRIGFVHV